MNKKSLGLFIILCLSPLIQSQSIRTIAYNPPSVDKPTRPMQKRGLAGRNEIDNKFSRTKLVSTDLDTAKLLSDQPLKSPMGAVFRSAAMPGWGQIYNEKYLKGLFVFSVNGAFAYAIYDYHSKWKDTGNKTFQNKRNLYTWYFGVSYFLTLIDAYVDAYLFGFEEAVELALSLLEQSPGYGQANAIEIKTVDQNIIGLKICFKL